MRRLGWVFAFLTVWAGAKCARAADADFNGRSQKVQECKDSPARRALLDRLAQPMR